MDINRRKFLQLAGTTTLALSFGKVHAASGEKILVVYFSRTGEEYGVGNITKGNTAIVAEIIAQKTGGDLFELKAVTPYPAGYEDCKKIVPFCTHGGSGLSSTDQQISLTCPTATVLKGFDVRGVTAQNNRSQAESTVDENLKRLGLI
ncbi:MAG: twin-arginine translocation signal domain-containing protein [Selenomonadaceae bacterium]|nr:twin-arginine translocation signal domain-containing protein [Selenomonadaceae bacterium]